MPTPNYDTSPQAVDNNANAIHDVDNDLQNLDWLQNFNLIQTGDLLMNLNQEDCIVVNKMLPQAFTTATVKIEQSPSPQEDETVVKSRDRVHQHRRRAARKLSLSNDNLSQTSRRKPFQCTFNCMVFRAIEASPHKALQLRSIYDWIAEKHSYFKTAGRQWHNSVRHSLSLNKCFYRLNIDLPDESGTKCNRSSWWTVHPDYRKAFSKLVLEDGPNHRCLPRGVMIGAEIDSVKKLSYSSENELATLANDIKAAAAILTLAQTNTPQHMKDIVDGVAATKFIVKPNSVVEIPQQQHAPPLSPPLFRQRTSSRNSNLRQKKQIRIGGSKNKIRRKRHISNSSSAVDEDEETVETCNAETQTDEIRIPQGNCVVEHLNYGGAVKIEFDLDAYVAAAEKEKREKCSVAEDSIQATVRCLMSSNVEQIESQKIVGRMSSSSSLSKKIVSGEKKKIKREDTLTGTSDSSWNLLKLVDQKCPMDQELV